MSDLMTKVSAMRGFYCILADIICVTTGENIKFSLLVAFFPFSRLLNK